jgi:hypothetical protein
MDEVMQKILSLTRKKMREAGEYGREAFHEYAEESLDFYLDRGEITEDENLDLLLEELMENYNDIESREDDK